MRYSFGQVKSVLYNYYLLSRGVMVNHGQEENPGIRVPHIGRAPFEAACLMAGEVGLRVKRCGLDGMLVEAVFMHTEEPRREDGIAREYGILDVHKRINRVVAYCTGHNIGCPDGTDKELWPMDYKTFCDKYRYRRDWGRKALNKSCVSLTKCATPLDKPRPGGVF